VLKGRATINLGTPGAQVYINNGGDKRELKSLPIALDIDTSKSWSIEATKTGYDDYNQAISFDDGQADKTYDVVLNVHGQAPPVTTTTAAVPPTAPTNTTTAPTATTAAPAATGEAFLNINSIPPSSCFLDGRPLGMTPQHVSTSPGPHQVKFVNSELGLSKIIGVNAEAGKTKLAAAKLN
jgi:serine/threonine-protein kinase